MSTINELKNTYSEGCYIIGKGASIDHATAADFPHTDWPIFCINQTVNTIEDLNLPNPIYSIQQDAWLDKKWIMQPKRATILTSTHCKHLFNNAYIYDQVNDLKITDKIITAVSAVGCAKLMGCKYIVFIGFDIATEHSDKHLESFISKYGVYPAEEKYKRFYCVIRLYLGILQIPAEFYSITKRKSIKYSVAPYTIITTTRDRPLAMRICMDLVTNQTILPKQWLIVDDGLNPLALKYRTGTTYIRREPKQGDPIHTAKINLLSAYKQELNDKILIFEDDDYYSPKYAETMLPFLDNYDLVGKNNILIYNLQHNMYHRYTNLNYSTFACTCFTKRLLPYASKSCRNMSFAAADVTLWSLVTKNKHLIPEENDFFIGIKGVGGQPGTTRAHRIKELLKDGFTKDTKCRDLLRSKLVDDYEYYEDIHKQEIPSIYVPSRPEYTRTNREISTIRGEIQPMGLEDIPQHLKNGGLRVLSDGKLHMIRGSTELKRFLDANFIKDGPKTWIPKSNSLNFNDLSPDVKDKNVYITGKGPSLDKIDVEDFDDSLIICINESVHKIDSLNLPNPVIACQQDYQLKNVCLGKSGRIIVSTDAQYWYSEIANKYVVSKKDLKIKGSTPTAVFVIELLKKLGVKSIKLMAFDSITERNLQYAKCIGYASNKKGDPKRFLGHHDKIYKSLEGVDYEFINNSNQT